MRLIAERNDENSPFFKAQFRGEIEGVDLLRLSTSPFLLSLSLSLSSFILTFDDCCCILRRDDTVPAPERDEPDKPAREASEISEKGREGGGRNGKGERERDG